MTNILFDKGVQNSLITEYSARLLEIESFKNIALKIHGGNEGQVRHVDKAKIAIEIFNDKSIETD